MKRDDIGQLIETIEKLQHKAAQRLEITAPERCLLDAMREIAAALDQLDCGK